MPHPIHFGRILPNYRFRTAEGEFFLSSAPEGSSATAAKAQPFVEARERDGQFAVLRGAVSDSTLLECSLMEALPPIASSVFARLVDANRGIRDKVIGIAREVHDELIGVEVPPSAKELPLAIAPAGPLPLCVLDVGHHPKAPGATGVLDGAKVSEHTFNKELADMIAAKAQRAAIRIISRDTGDETGRLGLPAKTNALNPNFVISLHANDFEPTSTGSEVLYYHTSTEGKKFATVLQRQFVAALGLRDRGIKPVTKTDRGGDQLASTQAPIVIGEPFFIGNPVEFAAVNARKDALANAYALAIDEYAATFSNPKPAAITAKAVTSHVETGTSFSFVYEALSKEQFYAQNRAELERLIASINTRLADKYGSDLRPLTVQDVWVLTYCECGLRNGKVDPDYRHSAGERGLLPLPEHIRDWNGPSAPAFDSPMPLARNIEHFYLYLGHLKNKDVMGKAPRYYKSLFRMDGITGNAVREAKLLAGVVHGYFYSPNYSDRSIPADRIIRGYVRDTPLADVMRNTTYVHAGTSILTGRQANIEEALQLI
jgi:N-acetylmuramoyl-L-alanine amidase